ncbi:RNA polymerase sigma factor [Steroidobacter flavus]|uniref:RNA polymerase sigma factor n=1 Tax=Steroidobacter flavus TaxID=1842136 RepID=A0ABV8T3X3_9GAMM
MSSSTTLQSEQIAQAFAEHRREVRNFLHGQLKCAHSAEDLTQETYLRLIRSEPTGVKDWRALIFRVARNLAIDHLRGKDRRTAFEHDLEALYQVTDDTPQMDDELVTQEEMERLERGLLALPERSRRVFELSREDGLSHREIGARLGLSVRTVARQMALAVQFLRERIER